MLAFPLRYYSHSTILLWQLIWFPKRRIYPWSVSAGLIFYRRSKLDWNENKPIQKNSWLGYATVSFPNIRNIANGKFGGWRAWLFIRINAPLYLCVWKKTACLRTWSMRFLFKNLTKDQSISFLISVIEKSARLNRALFTCCFQPKPLAWDAKKEFCRN